MKWEAVLLMVLLVALGFVLVYGPGVDHGLVEVRIGQSKGLLVEVTGPDAPERSFVIDYRDGAEAGPFTEAQLAEVIGEHEVRQVLSGEQNVLFRLLNITSWTSVPWIVLGFGAQLVFASRFIIQWVISERRKESVIPVAFWWVSFFGGVTLFAYFVWRQDPVGVLGQSSGIVIYARNLRLIYKKRRRDARVAARMAGAAAIETPAPDVPLLEDEPPSEPTVRIPEPQTVREE
jgi:lipid-A-disaccharide synthase-like uncharacterized protein